jgi:GWxTD domain-containing protein
MGVGLLALEAGLARSAAEPSAKRSKKELLADLPVEEQAWLTELVAPIILKEEEDLFLELSEGYQREIFKKDFWDRRELDSLGPPYGEGFQRRYEELRPRLDSEYDGWRSDAARMVLHYGEPAEIRRTEGCNGSVFRDLEIWTVQSISGAFRQTVHHIFYRPIPGVPRRLWVNESTALNRRTGNGCQGSSSSPENKLFQPSSCRKDFQSLLCDCRTEPGDPGLGPDCAEACDVYRVYQEILARQGSGLSALIETSRLFKLPDVSTEGLDGLRKRFATTADPNAKALSVEGPSSKLRAAPEPIPTPEPLRALTAEEVRDRIVHLEPKYRQFLDLAGPLLTEDALQRFLQMTPKDKDRFIREFWKRRS